MTYTSPLHIFDGREITGTDEASLKRLRRELLLQFDLQQKTTLELGGQEYDKASLLAAFDELKTDVAFHLKIYRNKDLLNFLENGSLLFFEIPESREDLADPDFRRQVAPYFTKKLSEIIWRCVAEKGPVSINRLRAIHQAGFEVPAEMAHDVYSETYAWFEQFLNGARPAALNPFEEFSKTKLRPAIEELLQPHYLIALKLLPKNTFHPIAERYRHLAYQVLVKTFNKGKEFRQLSKDTLKLLKNATGICLFHDPSDQQLQKLASGMQSYLDGGSGRNPDARSGLGFGQILLILCGLAIFGVRLLNFNNSSSSRKQPAINFNWQEKWKAGHPDRLAQSELAGRWEAVVPTGPDSLPVRYEYEMMAPGPVYLTLQLLDSSGSEKCLIKHRFHWDVAELDSTSLKHRHVLEFSEIRDLEIYKNNCLQLNKKETETVALLERNLQLPEGPKLVPVSYFLKTGAKWPDSLRMDGRVFLRKK